MSLLTSILTPPKTVAIIGLSDKPERPSFQVASYLLDHGFRILPVNPMLTECLGIAAYPSLSAIPPDIGIDIVDIFRRFHEVPAIIDEIIASQRHPVIWMQEGVVSPEAKQKAEEYGMSVIMDRCMMKEHRRLIQSA